MLRLTENLNPAFLVGHPVVGSLDMLLNLTQIYDISFSNAPHFLLEEIFQNKTCVPETCSFL